MALSKKLRFEILQRDGFRCVYCGASAAQARLHVDHVNSRATGGRDEADNLATSCEDCNRGKGIKSLEGDRCAWQVQPAVLRFKSDWLWYSGRPMPAGFIEENRWLLEAVWPDSLMLVCGFNPLALHRPQTDTDAVHLFWEGFNHGVDYFNSADAEELLG